MKTTAVGIFILLILTFTFPFQALSDTEERFGPWLYFAPYYFPPDRGCLGHCFSADDFRPIYESPNPPQPKNDAPPQFAPPPPRKTAARPGNLGPRAARQIAPMKPISTVRPTSSTAVKPKTELTRPGQPPVTLSPHQGAQPRMITPSAQGTQVR